MTHPLILIRGLPGSGKSTLAKQLCSASGAVHLETDQFFTAPSGTYTFNHNMLSAAHAWCQRATAALLLAHPVVVSNTFSRRWEIEPYLGMTPHRPLILHCTQAFGSIHAVPPAAIAAMQERWEPVLTEKIWEDKYTLLEVLSFLSTSPE